MNNGYGRNLGKHSVQTGTYLTCTPLSPAELDCQASTVSALHLILYESHPIIMMFLN
jgi:hypothetical protein